MGSIKQSPSSLPRPAAGKLRPCLTYPASGRTAFQKVEEHGSPRCAYHVGTGPTGRTLCAHPRRAELQRRAGLVGSCCGSGTPPHTHIPVSGPADVLCSPSSGEERARTSPVPPRARQGCGGAVPLRARSWRETGPEVLKCAVTLTPERLKC